MITANGAMASLEFAICIDNKLVMASFYDRSYASIKSVAASLSGGGVKASHLKMVRPDWLFHTYIQNIVCGKDRFYHALSTSEECGKSIFVTTPEREKGDFYNLLMNNYNYPILEEWVPYLLEECKHRHLVVCPYVRHLSGSNGTNERLIPIGNDMVAVKALKVYKIEMEDENLRKVISDLLKQGRIKICETPQKKLGFSNMDEYFEKYGHSLVSNLENQLEPLAPVDGNMKALALNNIRLMPPQAAQVNGLLELMKRSKYGILNMGMGTGKTITSVSAEEGYFNKKSGKTLHEIYSNENAIKYRNVVMCPGHLVEKWKKEIEKEVPNAKVSIINDLSTLVSIRGRGKRRTDREWFVIGKDFAKLGYQSVPVPKKAGYGYIKARACAECGTVSMDFRGKDYECKSCSSHKFKPIKIDKPAYGMICPFCNNVLVKNRNLETKGDEEQGLEVLDAQGFATQNAQNERCHICGEEMWQPHVANLAGFDGKVRKTPWYRATHYANKTHKRKKTVWLHEKFAEEYFAAIGEQPLNEKRSEGVRKYPPAQFIKKQLKGYFDFLILDELHLYKGGATAQGNAMHALIKSSKKVLGLTGTIAGGMANDLFYLLYRLDPSKMKAKGYGFKDVMKFTEKYGSLESVYDVSEGKGEYNKTSRGKQLQSPRPKPGISPLIFADFLMEKTVFLDLSDMSDMLPDYKEIVETVTIPDTVFDGDGIERQNMELMASSSYADVVDSLREYARGEQGRGVLGTMLQFALSYPDKPYGVPPIKSPFDGSTLVKVPSYDMLVEDGKLLAKEECLVKIVNNELSEGRNCVVYVEFTGKAESCITHRLKEVLCENCSLKESEVAILESSNPPAKEREAWMHKKAEKDGVKVFITNPKCVETGLDFIWEAEDGKIYNFPTLIFYQLGYSLFTIWQASRRAYRLIQKEECRTYYIAYAGTLQEMAIQLIAEKQVATAAIQGKFSAEGLSAMANGVDSRVRLAQALADKSKASGNLQQMFDTIGKSGKSTLYEDVEPMQTVSEILGVDVKKTEKKDVTLNSFNLLEDLNDMFEAFRVTKKDSDSIVEEEYTMPECERDDEEKALMDMFGKATYSSVPMTQLKKTKKDEKAKKIGIVSLFGIY